MMDYEKYGLKILRGVSIVYCPWDDDGPNMSNCNVIHKDISTGRKFEKVVIVFPEKFLGTSELPTKNKVLY